MENLRHMLGVFVRGRETQAVSTITTEEIEEHIARFTNAWSRATIKNRLSTFFGVAIKRGWAVINPCLAIDSIRIDTKPPQILTCDQARRLLTFGLWEATIGAPWLILTLLAGLRPNEADRISWDAIDFSQKTITVDAAASKVRQRRIVRPMPTTFEWLEEALRLGARLPLPHSSRRRIVRRARDVMGFETWPADILRHTCASYWLAVSQNAAQVAYQLGNSPGILMRHYANLVRPDEAEAFWQIRPRETTESETQEITTSIMLHKDRSRSRLLRYQPKGNQ